MTYKQRGDTISHLIDANDRELRFIVNRLTHCNPEQANKLADYLSAYLQMFNDMAAEKEAA
jgi:hypothetical protein